MGGIQTVSMTALTTGSLVGEARSRLRTLVDDSTLSDRERANVGELLSALASKGEDEKTRSDQVLRCAPCATRTQNQRIESRFSPVPTCTG